MIDPKFWSDDKMMALTTRHRLLFIGIWNFSDDGGIHKNSNNMLKAEVFPCDDIIVKEVGKLKDELIELELIIPFQSNGIELFYVKNWKIYQSIQKPIPSKYTLFFVYYILLPQRDVSGRYRVRYGKRYTIISIYM